MKPARPSRAFDYPVISGCLRVLPWLGVALLAGVGSLAANTTTWDPLGTPATGSDGPGTWDNTPTNKVFTDGTTDNAFSNGNQTVIFGVNGVNGTPGTITVSGNRSLNILRLLPVSGTTGYTFVPTTGSGTITTTTLTVNTAGLTSTINVPLQADTFNFTSPGTLLLGGGSAITKSGTTTSVFGTGTVGISGNNNANGIGSTIELTAGTYALGTSIGIGDPTGTSGQGVKVDSGAVLSAAGDLGVGGYAKNSSGELRIAGGTASATGASSIIYIDNNAPNTANPTASNLSGQIIIKSGALTGTNTLVVGNGLAAASQSAELDVNGGVIYLSNTTAGGGNILLNNSGSPTAAGTSTVKITGGVTTTGAASGVVFNAGGSTLGASTLSVSGGSLFVGNNGGLGGFSNAGTGNTATGGSSAPTITLSGGLVGAVSDWATSMPITLTTGANGDVTFQNSNAGAATSATTFVTAAASTPYQITLNGILSGNGGFLKTGNNTLILQAANTYKGATVVNAGTLTLTTSGSIMSSTVTINAGSGLTLQNTTNLASTLTLRLNSNTSGTGGSTALTLGYAGADTINQLFLDGNPVAPNTYSASDLAALDSGIVFSGGGSLTVLSSTPVPEPGSLALLAGAGALAALARARRRPLHRAARA